MAIYRTVIFLHLHFLLPSLRPLISLFRLLSYSLIFFNCSSPSSPSLCLLFFFLLSFSTSPISVLLFLFHQFYPSSFLIPSLLFIATSFFLPSFITLTSSTSSFCLHAKDTQLLNKKKVLSRNYKIITLVFIAFSSSLSFLITPVFTPSLFLFPSTFRVVLIGRMIMTALSPSINGKKSHYRWTIDEAKDSIVIIIEAVHL